jgi:hypothetical protein
MIATTLFAIFVSLIICSLIPGKPQLLSEKEREELHDWLRHD